MSGSIIIGGTDSSGGIYILQDTKCYGCGELVLGISGFWRPHFAQSRTDYSRKHYCNRCIGFSDTHGPVLKKLEGIRMCTPFPSGTPDTVVADWLEDNNLTEAAKYLRQYENVF